MDPHTDRISMKAVRFSSTTNPASSSALSVVDVPIPKPKSPGEVLVRIRATTVVRDNLTWPELYSEQPARLGNDFAGTVMSVYDGAASDRLKPGDHVFGMISAERGGAWAEYAVVTAQEVGLKPASLSWLEAAALPLSALTADQALFDKAGLDFDAAQHGTRKRVLVTGAAGGVGTYLIQLGVAAGHHVVAATSSNARNAAFLQSLGATQILQYDDLPDMDKVDAVVDTVGGSVLQQCWAVVRDGGRLVSIDSSSWDFAREHRTMDCGKGKDKIHAGFFIVEPSAESLDRILRVVERGGLQIFVAKTMPFAEAREAYELCQSGSAGRGKIVLAM